MIAPRDSRGGPILAPVSPGNWDRAGGYLFIDNLRFLSMIAIVMRHCELMVFGGAPPTELEDIVLQFRTFGVQSFFVTTAFLMADWLGRRNDDVISYGGTRFRQVFLPWIVWLLAYVAVEMVVAYFRPPANPVGVGELLMFAMFTTTYWFVPVLVFSLAVMLALKHYWNSTGLSIAFLALSLVYGVNLYAEWFPTSHTTAFLGYLFPMWVGIWIHDRYAAVAAFVSRLPWGLVFGLWLTSFLLTLAEDRVIELLTLNNDYNALQITNQIYSFVVLLAIMKVPVRLVPSFIDVRRETFGIYLTHLVVARFCRVVVNLFAAIWLSGPSLFVQIPDLVKGSMARMGVLLGWTALVYLSALFVAKAIGRSPLYWLVGLQSQTVPTQGRHSAGIRA